ncbi:kinase-like domain-containing protein [Cokeromyces recurvatus]|uniref:kinase-like domain-containing protein n=1 Tax=Cokeromyces recurvatus TaxID=90255 RepID=UPI0022210D0D|nr:kinase-like domain-containing protein [Cokeromyces recurvatus]KAI7898711.1 kinase-like domain-containing protein [Cokeromyces recurvatus]
MFTLFVEEPSRYLILIRFYEDFQEFDKRIKHYLKESKLCLPKLQQNEILQPNLSSRQRNHSFRQKVLQSLSIIKNKSIMTRVQTAISNADKIEKYLRHCIDDSNIQSCSLLKDFLQPQREEDKVILKDDCPQVQRMLQTTRHDAIQQQLKESCQPIINDSIHVSLIENIKGDNMRVLKNDSSLSSCTSETPVTIQDFQLIKVIGKGCMGKVLLVRHRRTSRLLALKAISKKAVIEQSQIIHIRTEQQILADIASIHHPFLIKLHYSFQDMNQLFLVLDYHVGGDLATQLKIHYTLTPERCRFYAAEIILGIQELHSLGIIYRDLKPENILLSAEGHVVLTDFGLSKQFYGSPNAKEQRADTFCGTAEYLAPEILNEQPYSYEVDYWSFGTILYEMLIGVTPFWAENRDEMYRRIREDPLQFPEFIDIETANFIAHLLKRDPQRRLGYSHLIEEGATRVRSDPYFNYIDWQLIYTKRIKPPYVPNLCSETDLSLFDHEFLLLTPRLSPVESDYHPSQTLDPVFEGYSYINCENCPPDSPPSEVYSLSEPPPITLLDTMIPDSNMNDTRYYVYNESDVIIPYDDCIESVNEEEEDDDDAIYISDFIRHRDSSGLFPLDDETDSHHDPPRPSRPVFSLKE